jgi:UDP-N-acetylglucosamine transferase subunit ALG13
VIFVTVGSTDFDGLIAAMDALAPDLEEEVVFQTGLGDCVPQNGRFFRFAPDLEPYYAQSSLVVAHGGLGTLVETLERGVKLICVVNPTTYDRHQEHLLEVFEKGGLLVWCRDLKDLGRSIQEAHQRKFAQYEPPECHIHEVIDEFLSGD